MMGAKTNCPSDPPALMIPEAVPRAVAGNFCEAAPIRTEKLLAPAPAAEIRPMANVRPRPDAIQGVIEVPSARISKPAIRTGRGPYLSAAAPASGWIAPQTNWPMARAKLMVAIPSPV